MWIFFCIINNKVKGTFLQFQFTNFLPKSSWSFGNNALLNCAVKLYKTVLTLSDQWYEI